MNTNSRFAVAVHVLALLARAGDEPIKSEQIARSVNTNPVVIRRILCALSRAGLVASQTGAAGGSRLARQPRQIALLEVYRAVAGGDVFSLHHKPPSRRCFVGNHIEVVLEEVLVDVNRAVETVLARINLEQILGRLQLCAQKMRRG